MRLQKSSTAKRLGIGLTAAAVLITSACAAKVNQTSSSARLPHPSPVRRHPAGSAAPAAPASSAAGSAAASMAPASSSGAAASGSATGAKMLPVTGTCSAPINMAMNDWVGYTADAAVVTYVLENDLKCKVNQKALAEELAWQGLPSGQIDVIMENWGHADLTKKYITQQKTAVDAGLTGNLGQIGWYVPPSTSEDVPRHHQLAEPEQVRVQVRHVGIRWKGSTAGR